MFPGKAESALRVTSWKSISRSCWACSATWSMRKRKSYRSTGAGTVRGRISRSIKDWKPVDLAFQFSEGGVVDGAGVFLFQCLLGMVSGINGSFDVSVELPSDLKKALAQTLKVGQARGKKSKRNSLANAIGSLAVMQEIGRSGLSLELGPQPDPDGHKACLGLLFVLAQLQQGDNKLLSVKLNSSKNAITASVTFHGQVINGLPDASVKSLPVSRADGQQRMGVIVQAHVAGLGTPLEGWNVALVELTRKRPGKLLQARTNRQGKAELLRLQPRSGGYHLSGKPDIKGDLMLVLYTPDGREVLRKDLDRKRPIETNLVTRQFPDSA